MVKVPRAAAERTPAAVAAVWDPPSEPRLPRLCAEPCPHCGAAQVYATPRGTVRACVACQTRVTPPGVLSPYERGTETARAAKSQHERDLEALGLAGRKGVMLGELRRLADDDRLDDASVMKVEWFAEQVKAAGSGARLDELAALFADAGIWPHRSQATPLAGYGDDDNDGDGYQGGGLVTALAAPAAIAAPARRATWADAFAAHGWRLAPGRGDEVCQVAERDNGRCAEEIGGHPPVTDGLTRDGWVCSGHYYALVEATVSINRARGFS